MANTVARELIAVYQNPETPKALQAQIRDLIQNAKSVDLIIEVNDLLLMRKLLCSQDCERLSVTDVRNAWQFICSHKDLDADDAARILDRIDSNSRDSGECYGYRGGKWSDQYPLSEADLTKLVLKASDPENNRDPLGRAAKAHEFLYRRRLLDRGHPTMVELRRRVMAVVRRFSAPHDAATALIALTSGIGTSSLESSEVKELYDLILEKEDHVAAYRSLHEGYDHYCSACGGLPEEVKEKFTSLMRAALEKMVADDGIRLARAYRAAAFGPWTSGR